MAHQFSKDVCQVLATLCLLPLDFVMDALDVPSDRLYQSFVIPKKRGGTRLLHEPCNELKVVQGALLPCLYKRYALEPRFFGYIPGRSAADNARYHIWRLKGEVFLPRSMFHVDLKDAFPSARDKRLARMFAKMFSPKKFLRLADGSMDKAVRLHQEFVDLLLYLTTHECSLPQGAATSPYLLNLLIGHMGILREIDRALGGQQFRLSIYADDITVSSPYNPMSWRFRRGVITAIQRTGFRINPKKTRYNQLDHKSHCVTGVSLSLDPDGRPKLTLSQKARDTLRGNIHRATLALEQGREPIFAKDGITLSQAHGHVGWIQEVYDGFELPSDVGMPLTDFKIAYAAYKSTKEG